MSELKSWIDLRQYDISQDQIDKSLDICLIKDLVGEIITEALMGPNNSCIDMFKLHNGMYRIFHHNQNGDYIHDFEWKEIERALKQIVIYYDYKVRKEY